MVINSFIPYYSFNLQRRLASLPTNDSAVSDPTNPTTPSPPASYYVIEENQLHKRYKLFYFTKYLLEALLINVFWNSIPTSFFLGDLVSNQLLDVIICPSIGYVYNPHYSFLIIVENNVGTTNFVKQVYQLDKDAPSYPVRSNNLSISIEYTIKNPLKTISNIPYSITGGLLSVSWPIIRCEHDYEAKANITAPSGQEIGFLEVYSYQGNELPVFSNVFYNNISIPTQYSTVFSFPFCCLTPDYVYVINIYPSFRQNIQFSQGNSNQLYFY